jgi:tetratricopeptide (TPR) repeat protein
MGFVAAQLKNMMKRFLIIASEQQFCIGSECLLSIGNAYLAVDKKQEALSAFRSSYQMDYDAKVKKLAHEQYAKLSYDIGNPFESPSAVIQNYINENQNASNASEMRSLLVKSYLYSGNYKETLNAIDRLQSSTPEINKVDQEVSYLLGTEEFNKGIMMKLKSIS